MVASTLAARPVGLPLALAAERPFLGALFLGGLAVAARGGGAARQIRFEAGEPLLRQAPIEQRLQHVGWAELSLRSPTFTARLSLISIPRLINLLSRFNGPAPWF